MYQDRELWEEPLQRHSRCSPICNHAKNSPKLKITETHTSPPLFQVVVGGRYSDSVGISIGDPKLRGLHDNLLPSSKKLTLAHNIATTKENNRQEPSRSYGSPVSCFDQSSMPCNTPSLLLDCVVQARVSAHRPLGLASMSADPTVFFFFFFPRAPLILKFCAFALAGLMNTVKPSHPNPAMLSLKLHNTTNSPTTPIPSPIRRGVPFY